MNEINKAHIDLENHKTIYAGNHEFFLSFNSDWMAEAFEDWFLFHGGIDKFVRWANENKDDYDI